MRSNRRSNCFFAMTLLALVSATAFNARAQPGPSPSPTPAASATPTLESRFLKNILRDQKAIWTAPGHLRSPDARWAVPLGIGTAALIATDRQTGDKMAEFDRALNASRIISYAGSGYGVGAVAATFYLVGRARKDDRARETGILGAEALVDSAIVVTSVKEITQRRRPTAAQGRGDFFDGGSSFPSGHSISAWSLAAVVADEYHDHVAVQVAAYGIAGAVSLARFTGRKHYLSDVLVGSALGWGIGHYVYHAHHRKSSPSAGGEEESEEESATAGGLLHHRPIVFPQYDRASRSYGVVLAWTF